MMDGSLPPGMPAALSRCAHGSTRLSLIQSAAASGTNENSSVDDTEVPPVNGGGFSSAAAGANVGLPVMSPQVRVVVRAWCAAPCAACAAISALT